jgi:hypothetical protein
MARFDLFEGPVAVKAGTTSGTPVIKLVEAGKSDKAYDAADVAGVLAAIARGMEATGLPLMRYSAYMPGLTRKNDKAHYTPADLKKALAAPDTTVSVRAGRYGPVLAVMAPLTTAGVKPRNQSF